MTTATAVPGASLLSPGDHTLILIDHQSQMAFATHSIDISALRNNVALIAKGAKGFKVPVILTTVAEKSFSGPLFAELPEIFPGEPVFDRTSMNAWEDTGVIDRVNAIGKRRLVIAGLWTSVCIVGPTLSAIEQGFEVYVITDACGDVSDEAHERAVTRMVQAGAAPITSVQYLLELQRDLRADHRYCTRTCWWLWHRHPVRQEHVRCAGRRALNASAPRNTAGLSLALLMLRIAGGGFLLPHGLGKLLGWFGGPGLPGFAAELQQFGFPSVAPLPLLLALVQTLSGLVGLWTRASAALAALFIATTVLVAMPKGWFWMQGGMEYPLMWLLVLLAVAAAGGGAWSLDHLRRRSAA